MDKAIQTVGVLVFNNKNQVVLVKHGEKAGHLTGVYGIPGGRGTANEDIIKTAIRELYEETGFKILKDDLYPYQNNRYSARIKRKDGSINLYTMTIYIAKKYAGKLKGSRETTPVWIDISKISEFNLLPNVEKAVNEGYKNLI